MMVITIITIFKKDFGSTPSQYLCWEHPWLGEPNCNARSASFSDKFASVLQLAGPHRKAFGTHDSDGPEMGVCGIALWRIPGSREIMLGCGPLEAFFETKACAKCATLMSTAVRPRWFGRKRRPTVLRDRKSVV